MENLLNHLYTSFIYRDLLAYTVPGFLTIYASLWCCGKTIDIEKITKYPFFILMTTSFILGLMLTAVGTSGESFESWPFLRHAPTIADMRDIKTGETSNQYNTRLQEIPAAKRGDYAMNILERFIAFKQLYGNISFTCCISMVCVIVKYIRGVVALQEEAWYSSKSIDSLKALSLYLIAVVAFFAMGTISLCEHRNVVNRQFRWQQIMYVYFNDRPTPDPAK